MILDSARVVAGYPFTARRHGRVPLCDAVAVAACFDTAAEPSAGRGADEPAAVFFALASKRRAFPFAWKLMARIVARAQAEANGLHLDADAAELDALCAEVLYKRATWESVRGWFAERVRAAGG